TKPSPSVLAKPLQIAPRTPAASISKPAAPAMGAPRSITPPPAPAKPGATPLPATTPAAQSAAPAGRGVVLQIGSYTSETEANTSWQTYKAAHSSVAGYAPDV